jgi:hypothetical protein
MDLRSPLSQKVGRGDGIRGVTSSCRAIGTP